MLKNYSRKHFFSHASHGVMRELMALGFVALMSPALLGCQSSGPAYWQNAPVDYRDRHPIVVGDAQLTLTLYMHYALRGRVGLSRDQYDSIREFMERYAKQGKGGILALVTVPPSMETVRTRKKGCRIIKVRVSRSREYLMSVRRQLVHAGIPSHLLTVQKDTRLEGEAGRVQLKFLETRARVATRCGLWPTDLAGAAAVDREGYRSIGLYTNEPYWNLGCATQSNLATQADNPRDFVQMRAETLGDSVKSLLTVQKYRGGESRAE
jgi:pilus assembly protein CpaD